MPDPENDTARLTEAAELAFALLRFETAAANRHFTGGQPDKRTLGIDDFRFLPVGRRVPKLS